MCYNPLTIRNQGWPYRLAALPYLEVPCGKCLECQNVQKLDYLIRCIATYKALPADKWSVFFCTFTFRPSDVPVQEIWQKTEPEPYYSGRENLELNCWSSLGQVRCFDHRLLHRFCKNFRQYYRRKFSRWHKELNPETKRYHKVYDYVPDALNLPHCLFTSEFGEDDEHLHLPHYHGIVFVPECLQWWQFRDIVQKFWHYGFTKNIKIALKDGQFYERDDYKAFEYVCKYVNKNSGYLPELLRGKNLYCEIGMHNVMPRVFTTNGFGSFLRQQLTHDDMMRGKFRYDVSGQWREFYIPKYFLRQYFVKTDQKVSMEKVYCPATPFEDGHYEMKRKVESRSVYSEEYLDLRQQKSEDKIKSDYIHAQSAFLSSALFKDRLREIGFPWLDDDVNQAFKVLSRESFLRDYLSAIQFPHVVRCKFPEDDRPLSERIFNNRIPDKDFFHVFDDQMKYEKLRIHHLYNTMYLFDDVNVQIIASLIDAWRQYDRENKEMRALKRYRDLVEYCKLHGIKKNSHLKFG